MKTNYGKHEDKIRKALESVSVTKTNGKHIIKADTAYAIAAFEASLDSQLANKLKKEVEERCLQEGSNDNFNKYYAYQLASNAHLIANFTTNDAKSDATLKTMIRKFMLDNLQIVD